MGVLKEGAQSFWDRGGPGQAWAGTEEGAWTVGTAGGQAHVEGQGTRVALGGQGPEHGHFSWGSILLLFLLGNLKSAMWLWEKTGDFFP